MTKVSPRLPKRRRRTLWFVILLTGLLAEVSWSAPPKVVRAVPDNGDEQVDPMLRDIRVTFDQPMDTGGGWSIVGGGSTFPQLDGRAKWDGDRTIVISVRLNPDHAYWLSVNSDQFTNFRGADGTAAEPYPIAFRTRSAGAIATGAATRTTSVELNRTAIGRLRTAIDEDYAYRDRLGIDWDGRFRAMEPKLEAAASPAAFARAVAELLAPAKDPHLWLNVGPATVPTHRTGSAANYDLAALSTLVPGWKDHGGGVFTGRLEGDIGYVLVSGWTDDQRNGLEAAYALVAESPTGLIIDVRPNGGGDELMARHFAGCFVAERKVYSRNTIRRDGRDEGPFDRVVEPNKARAAYRGPVAVLIGPRNLSSNESFILMMKQAKWCTLVGEKTYGSSGNPRPFDLGNGVVVFVPSWQDQFPDGRPLEGVGIEPDARVIARPAQIKRRDPILDAALGALQN